MSPQRGIVRSGRSGSVVAVTGAAGAVGAAVTRALQDLVGTDGGPERVIAVDERRGPVDGPTWRLGDVADPAVAECLDGADHVVHVTAPTDLEAALDVPVRVRRLRVVRAAQAVATATAAVGARYLLAITSAMVYGARPDNPVPLPEDAPLAAHPDDGLVGDLLEVERVLARIPRSHVAVRVGVLRPAALVGPGVDTVVTRHFEAPRLLAVRGATTRWQFCHVDDLGTGAAVAVTNRLAGSLTAGTDGALAQEDVERLSGMRRVEIPPGLAFGTAERLHRVGVLPMPAGDLAYVVHPWVVSSARLREAGWAPRHDAEECLSVLLDGIRGRHALVGRRVERRDAALGAASAAVALVGTAAVLRQARSRRERGRRPTL
ncbi:MAG: NAD-dependent epimerase/dehydratase family protein [Actinomycetales bacterium]|nr:NAD-dependent epimerase/dehydratase family protein [Actinomycetales bacterium]